MANYNRHGNPYTSERDDADIMNTIQAMLDRSTNPQAELEARRRWQIAMHNYQSATAKMGAQASGELSTTRVAASSASAKGKEMPHESVWSCLARRNSLLAAMLTPSKEGGIVSGEPSLPVSTSTRERKRVLSGFEHGKAYWQLAGNPYTDSGTDGARYQAEWEERKREALQETWPFPEE